MPSEALSPADAAIVETFVVPRYLSLFGEVALEMLLGDGQAHLAHIGCRTGYPDRELRKHFSALSLVGIDGSAPALELARNKVAVLGEVGIEYREVAELPSPLRALSFSHALSLCPMGTSDDRAELFNEMAGLLYTGGQALVAMPLRGSFQEIGDLWKEYALKVDDGEFGKRVDEAWLARPTLESLSEELENAGLDDVDVEVRPTTLVFDSGRAFVEDPVTRLLVLPDVGRQLGGIDLKKPLDYLRDAIDRYFSEGRFELTVNVGCASARKVD